MTTRPATWPRTYFGARDAVADTLYAMRDDVALFDADPMDTLDLVVERLADLFADQVVPENRVILRANWVERATRAILDKRLV